MGSSLTFFSTNRRGKATSNLGLIALAALLILGGCNTTSTMTPNVTYMTYKLTPEDVALVQEGVKRSLKDPLSALFAVPPAASKGSDGIIYACGYVNAKNSFGGYIGDKLYLGTLAVSEGKPVSFITAAMGGSDIDDMVVRRMCQQRQIFL